MKTEKLVAEMMKNGPLARLIIAGANPYQAQHVAKAFKLKDPTSKFTQPKLNVAGNPWSALMGK